MLQLQRVMQLLDVTHKEKELMIPMYKAIARPHLEYGIQYRLSYRRKDI